MYSDRRIKETKFEKICKNITAGTTDTEGKEGEENCVEENDSNLECLFDCG